MIIRFTPIHYFWELPKEKHFERFLSLVEKQISSELDLKY